MTDYLQVKRCPVCGGEGSFGLAHVPDRRYFKIGEVAELLGVEQHVIRHWITTFNVGTTKTRGRHWRFRRKSVERLSLIRDLMHKRGLTTAGAKKVLAALVSSSNEEGMEVES